ncbi:cAMP-dependent protein kinase [Aureococcus anophagefferens]|nr:cAMP-dependent protein kinase [Aureococcus anophagefferens]
MAAFEALVHSKYDVDDTTTNAKQGGKIFGERMELSDIASFEIVDEMHTDELVARWRVDLESEELLFHRADASEHFTRDDVGDAMYVVHSGAVVCRVESADVALGPGDHFGERALLYNDTRAADVDATQEDTRCFAISREVFEAHLGMLSDILEHNLRTHVLEVALAGRAEDLDLGRLAEAADAVTFVKGDEIATADEPADHLFVVKSGVAHRVEPAKARPSSNPLAEAGRLVPWSGGACGEEALDDDADCYAFTVVAESESVSCYRLSAAALADEAFRKQYEEVVEPVKTDALSDDDTVEAPQRPSLTTPRRTSEPAPLKDAAFYASNVILALKYAHGKRVLYRDVKPENLLVDRNGYLKVVDFGFGKRLGDDELRSYTMCGTPEYLAPEVIDGSGHAFAADFWSVGCLLFEMLAGKTPFVSEDGSYNQILLFKTIKSEDPVIPATFDDPALADAKDCILALLDRDANGRLGASKRGADDPLEARVSDDLDCHNFNFDEDEDDMDEIEPYEGAVDFDYWAGGPAGS